MVFVNSLKKAISRVVTGPSVIERDFCGLCGSGECEGEKDGRDDAVGELGHDVESPGCGADGQTQDAAV
jgi:hypothetical protein